MLKFLLLFYSSLSFAQPPAIPKIPDSVCSNNIVVAVIDTGIDYTNLVFLEYFRPGNLGWNFVDNSMYPWDDHGHGTHIAGLIIPKAKTKGCPGIKIIPIKYFAYGFGNMGRTEQAIEYAINAGVNIINYSSSGSGPSKKELAILKRAKESNILFITAAGNDGHNLDTSPDYPASYDVDNIISVAALNQQGRLWKSSNFGSSVDIAALGERVESYRLNGTRATMSGTSQATANVSYIATELARLTANKVPFNYMNIKRWIIHGALPLVGNERGTLVSSGIADLQSSLKIAQRDLKKVNPKEIHKFFNNIKVYCK